MDDIKGMLAKRAGQVKPNVKLHSEIHALADEISTALGERKRFAMYLGVIKRVGVPAARRIFRQMQQESKDPSGRLFMYLCRKNPKAPQTPGGTAEPAETNPDATPTPKNP